MSDLTITHAGIATTKNSGAEVLTVEKRLTQMKMTVIDVAPTVTTNNCSDGEILFNAFKIENIVNTKGGSCVIQSIQLVDDDDKGAALDLVFQDTNIALGTAGGAIDAADGVMPDSIIGIVRITNYFDGILWQIGHKSNLGLVIKAQDTVRDIYVAAVNRSGGALTWTAAGIKLKIGVIQD